jgi:hypothetical protein
VQNVGAFAQTANNLSDVANVSTALTNLGGLAKASNLSDVANATAARGNLSAAKSGANSDITSLSGLTTALSVSQGGTGATTAAGARTALGVPSIAGDTFTGDIHRSGAAGTNRQVIFDTAGLARWGIIGANLASESGSNAGSDFALSRYNDAGNYVDSPLLVSRASGIATFSNGVVLPDGNTLMGVSSGKNRIINGDMRVAQRGTSTTTAPSTSAYDLDRWAVTSAGTGCTLNITQSSLADENGLTKFFRTAAINVAPTSIASGNSLQPHRQVLEGLNVYDLVGKQVTISFTARATTPGTYAVSLRDGGGTNSCVKTFSIASAGTAVRYSLTFPAIPSGISIPETTAAGLILVVGALNTGTLQASATDTWLSGNFVSVAGITNWSSTVGNNLSITEVQLEAGSVATPFERRSYEHELVLCQRYYEVGNQPFLFMSGLSGVTSAYGDVRFARPKRAAASITCTGWQYFSGGSNTGFTPTSITVLTDVFRYQGLSLTSWTGWAGAGTWTASAEL